MRAVAVALLASLVLTAPAAAAGGGAKPAGEEMFTLNELRVPLADSDPVRIMSVRMLLVMDTAESKAAMRSKQKEVEQELSSTLSQIPSSLAVKPGAPNDIKKIVAQSLDKAGVKGVKDVLVQKYLLW